MYIGMNEKKQDSFTGFLKKISFGEMGHFGSKTGLSLFTLDPLEEFF